MLNRFIPRAIVPGVYILAALPLFLFGYTAGHDWSFELPRARVYFDTLLSGQLPPYWAGQLYGGYGSPIFLHYPPLYLMTTALFQGLVDLPLAAGLASLVFLAVAAWGCSFLARAAGLEGAGARLVIGLFLLSPYFLGDLYLRNANAEFAALCILPFALAGVLVLPSKPEYGSLLLALGLAGVILAHNLTALSACAIVVAGLLLLYANRPGLRVWLAGVIGLVLALGLSAFFWMPAFWLRGRMRLTDLQRGKFVFEEHFQDFLGVFSPGWNAGAPAFLVLVVATIIIIRDLFSGGRREEVDSGKVPDREREQAQSRLLAVSWIGALLLLALVFPFSRFLWEQLPFLPLFQFPSRFLGPTALLVALMGGLCFDLVMRTWPVRRRRLVEGAVLLVLVSNALPTLLLTKPLTAEQKRSLAHSSLGGTTVYNEYVPRGATAGIWQLKPPVAGPLMELPAGVEIDWTRNEPIFMAGRVQAETAVRLSFARWAVEEWRAEIDGAPVPLSRSRFGTLELEAPAGTHSLLVEMRPPFLRRVGLWVSLSSLGLLVAGLVFRRRLLRSRDDR